MPKRSPILGYNHNVRHRGVVFHVQTEDSGVDNPHLFTHLFHGGTILSTRRLDYDAESDEDVVKSLMQSQHKAMLKDLKSGTFDDKIDRYLGDHPDLERRAQDRTAEPLAAVTQKLPPSVDTSATQEVPTLTLEESSAAPAPVDDEDSDTTIRIEQYEAPAELELELEAAPPAPHFDQDETTPPTRPGVMNAAAKQLGDPRATMGIGSDVLGRAHPALPNMHRIVTGPTASPAAPTAPTPAARLAAVAADPRRAPGAVEFRPPSGDTPKVTFKKARAPTDAELSAAFRAIHLETEAPPSAPVPVASRGQTPGEGVAVPAPSAVRNPEADSFYFHTRSGRHSNSPDVIEDQPSQRTEKVRLREGAVTVPPAPETARPRPPIATPRPRSTTLEAGGHSPPASAARPRSTTLEAGGRSPAARADVVVSRPSVIVGAPPRRVGTPPRPPEAKPPARRESGRPGLFAKDLISEKSLDEVILAYLSEDSEDKK